VYKFLSALCIGCVLLVGCKHYEVRVDSGTVPGVTPVKTDPVFVALPNDSNIRERQLLPILNSEMAKNGFNIVTTPSSAQWVLVPLARSESRETGATTKDENARTSHTDFEYTDEVTVQLALFPAMEYLGGKQRSVWGGSAFASQDVYDDYTKTILKNLLDVYGTTFSGDRELSRRYQNAP
jgi:hypothetical protein